MNPESIDKLIQSLKKLPGIGERTAERILYHIIHQPKSESLELANSIKTVKEKIVICSNCCDISEVDPCMICQDKKRSPEVICVVEQPRDLRSIEKTASFKGQYHVLHGVLAPIDGITEKDLTVGTLLRRIQQNKIKEIIIATNPTVEGEATFSYLYDAIRSRNKTVKVTRIAKGVPHGHTLEYLNPETIKIAMESRKTVL